MDNICPKDRCTGCMACVNVCPREAICTIEDSKGFLYPTIDQKLCISCGKCKTVCPQNTMSILNEPKKVYAMLAKEDSLRNKSSSGGVFSLLARNVLRKDGVVFGAAFDQQWRVSHCMAQTEEGLEKLRTSKYVQSNIGLSFREVKNALNQNRQVLFVGTPCQIDGLRKYLGKEAENLLTMDLVCHGAPSPGVFARWIEYETYHHGAIETISFREKVPGWKTFRVRIRFINGELIDCKQNEGYMAGFLRNIYLRESCYRCPYACTVRTGDITLGDYWGYQETSPEYIEDDDRGISLVFANTEKGMDALKRIHAVADFAPRTIEDAMRGNTVLKEPAKRSKDYEMFWKDYEDLSWEELMERYAPSTPDTGDSMHPTAREYYARPYVKRHWKHRILCLASRILQSKN